MGTLCRQIKLSVVGDKEEVNRVFSFIRDGQYAQYQALNLLMGQLSSEFYSCGRNLNDERFKEARKRILTNSNPQLDEINFAVGVDTKSAVTQVVKQDFSTAIKNGLARGERSITNYKRTYPLITRGRNLKFFHKYDSYNDFLDNLYSPKLKLYIKWVNKIVFEVVIGNPHRSAALRDELKNILEENYKIQGSSIEIDGKEIILHLSISIPEKELLLDEETVVGVDLGINIPAVCAVNNREYARLYIGSREEFLNKRMKIRAQRRRLQTQLQYKRGGHGRNKKLQQLENFKDYEANWVKTYNHMVSKKIVDFAISNSAKYINIENLEGYGDDKSHNFLLGNWSYYQLQQFVEYKAKQVGIKVRYVNPYHTSQTCNVCGHWEEGQRIDQEHFVCKACGNEMNADLNAAKNIAKSVDFSLDREAKSQRQKNESASAKRQRRQEELKAKKEQCNNDTVSEDFIILPDSETKQDAV